MLFWDVVECNRIIPHRARMVRTANGLTLMVQYVILNLQMIRDIAAVLAGTFQHVAKIKTDAFTPTVTGLVLPQMLILDVQVLIALVTQLITLTLIRTEYCVIQAHKIILDIAAGTVGIQIAQETIIHHLMKMVTLLQRTRMVINAITEGMMAIIL
jgi:hypothetical protein